MEQQQEIATNKNFVFENISRYINSRMDLRYNTVKLATEYRNRGEEEYFEFSDRDNAALLLTMKEDNEFKFAKSDFNLYMNSSKHIPDFDPYKDYFDSLPMWNGETDYIKKLASYIKVDEADHYYFFVQLKKWLVRVVKCALESNYFNKQILVFVGETQNTGKTTFCRFLCPKELQDYYSEEATKGKDEALQLTSNFLILYDELVKLNQTGLEEVKAILSKTKVKMRMPYARREQTFLRRCSFMGNTNQTQYLTDETGSVRFLSFLLHSIDFRYSQEININDVYAQAYHLYKSNYNCELTTEELNALKDYNKKFFVTTTEHDMILEYIRPAEKADFDNLSTTIYQWQAGQILQYLQDNNTAMKFNLISLGKALKFLGFERIGIKNKGVSKYAYQIVLNHESTLVREILKNQKYKRKNQEL